MKLNRIRTLLPILAAVGGFGVVAAPVPGWAADASPAMAPYETVSVMPAGAVRELDLPRVLSDEDVRRYRKIFAVQEPGDWKAADRLITELENPLLLGHVMSQRYLHPTKYRSKYKELKAWMGEYADHPEARRIYKLSLRRKPSNWRAPNKPDTLAKTAKAETTARIRIPAKRLNKKDRRRVRQLKRQIRSQLRRGHTLSAKRLIQSEELKRLFSIAEQDKARARLGRGYFSDGRDDWALKWAGDAGDRSGKYVPEAHWIAGLAAWRLDRKDLAARHFEAAANHSDGADWFHSGAAFWAARGYLVARRPEMVMPLLQRAAKHQRTFYGLLARRILGLPMAFRWALPPMNDDTVARLSTHPRGERAMALLQVGEVRRAERELRNLSRADNVELAHGILGLAARGNMASLAVRLDQRLYPNGGGFDGAAYPVPMWTPIDGFRVDRALIYAVIRQESKFNPKAKSWAGARGLMQLMPRTASFVARDSAFRWTKKNKLYKPEINLKLGQKYIEILLKDAKIKGDLFLMAAAWNGGPGNLNKWRRKIDYKDDPLFFIESLPSRETRIFIERVLSNLWIYRNRLGQGTPSLSAIAAGEWPVYTPLGQEPEEVAEIHGARD